MDTFSELVDIQWNVGQPQESIVSLISNLDRLDAALARISTDSASRFSANLQTNLVQASQGVSLLIGQFERLQALQNQVGQSGGGVLTANRYGQEIAPSLPARTQAVGTERLQVEIDETQRQAEANAIRSTDWFQSLKSKVQSMRGSSAPAMGGGGEGDFEWLAASDARQARSYAPASLKNGSDLGMIGVDVEEQVKGFRSALEFEQMNSLRQVMSSNRGLADIGQSVSGQMRGYDFASQFGDIDKARWSETSTQRMVGAFEKSGMSVPDYERISKLGEDAFNSQEKFGNSVKGTTAHVIEQSRGFDLLNNRFSRHIASVGESLLIYGAYAAAAGVVVSTVSSMVEAYRTLEDTTARLDFISPTTTALGQFQQAAQYGIRPEEAQGGIIAGAQIGASDEQQTQARQLALVFGTDQYTNALNELVQSEIRANAAGIEHVNTMDYIATAYQTTPGSLEQYMDALQNGIELQDLFDTSAERAALTVLKVGYATEQTPDAVANMLERVRKNITDPGKRDQYESLGITGTTSSEMLREAAALQAQFVQTGQTEQSEKLTKLLSGGIGGTETLRQMSVALAALNQAFGETNDSLAEFDTLVESVSETTSVRIRELDASWKTFLMALSNTAPVQIFFDYLNERLLGSTTSILENTSTLMEIYPKYLSSLTQDPLGTLGSVASGFSNRVSGGDPEQGWDKLLGGTGENLLQNALDPLGALERYTQALTQSLTDVFGTPEGGEGSRSNATSSGPLLTPRATWSAPPPPEFGGFQNLPKGTDWDTFVSSVREQEQKIKEQVPEYELDRRTIAFYDETNGTYRKLVADSEAIRRANDEQNKLLQQITGVFNVPAGGEVLVPFSALQSGFVPSNRFSGATNTEETNQERVRRIPGSPERISDREQAAHRNAVRSIPSRVQRDDDGRGEGSAQQERALSRESGSDVNVQVYVDGQQIASRLNRTLYRRASARMRGGTGGLLVS